MARKFLVVLAAAVLLWAGAGFADWEPSQPAKWVQFPDLTRFGIDVNDSYQLILADDFQCTEGGYIPSIHIWGSWLNDYYPYGEDPGALQFTLSIHADIPASQSPTGYSMPGDVLWWRVFQPGQFSVQIWAEGIQEGWMDPPEGYIFPADFTCWQYNFWIPADEQFYQTGTPGAPVVYWLDVKAEPYDDLARFGWKSAQEHWNDDAVWGQGYEPYGGPWYELRYPPGHEQQGQSMDLAFVIVGEEGPDYYDWGDAPDSPAAPGYPTLSANGGAFHVIAGPWLGDTTDNPDPNPDGLPDPNALGDDTYDGSDDEDGVLIPVLTPGTTSTITFEVNGGNGWVEGWIDFNADKIWQGSEMVYSNLVAPGTHSFNITTPASAVPGQTFARFRISTAGGLPPGGGASDGEVEDHEVWIEEGQAFKWIQRPDLTDLGIDVDDSDPYLLADDFLCTEPGRIVEIWVWGSWLNDWLPFGTDPTAVDFCLSFHKDIPAAQSPTGYSMPGGVEWYRYFTAGEFEAIVYASNIQEGWMEPPDVYWWPADYTCWLYKFWVHPSEAFFQAGSEAEPIVYWLDVQAYPHDPDAFFGWKTSIEHWNDDAVWIQAVEPYNGDWFELRYPPGHEQYGHSIDLAFALRNDETSGVPGQDVIPEGFGLFQNVPNPFGSTTTMRYNLPSSGHVRLEIFDVTGRLVSTVVDDIQAAGLHTLTWSGSDLPAGVYFQKLTIGEQVESRKMLLLK